MRPRRTTSLLLPSLVMTLLLATLSPGASAGTADQPDVADAAGDVTMYAGAPSPQPCKDAVDLTSFWVAWEPAGARFHYQFADLSTVTGMPVQDVAGRCFYSYADFTVIVAGKSREDTVYMDYNGFPLYATGWRFSLHEAQVELEGAVDLAAGTIEVLVPMDALGNPGPGDSIGAFRVQAATALVGLGYDYAGDFAPDDGKACDCQVVIPGAPAASSSTTATRQSTPARASAADPAAEPASTDPAAGDADGGREESAEAPGLSALFVALALVGLAVVVRRRV